MLKHMVCKKINAKEIKWRKVKGIRNARERGRGVTDFMIFDG